MKLLSLLLSVSFLTLVPASVALADCSKCGTSCTTSEPVTFMVTKAGPNTAKLTAGSKEATVPIEFADGANWDNVKDSYTLGCDNFCKLEAKKLSFTVDADGKASFRPKKC